ncbi:uncharacterized protein LOC134716321 isoform X2 [Mytilus trossulus]|uniref:uncharacterized protein LOC134716321 isoform X2 n=1 Tax=Mytilus trossulus TaxID=6551 RepID=UPI003006B88A
MYAVCVLFFLTAIFNLTVGCPDCFEKIDTIIQNTLRCKSKQIVGVSVAVVRSGEDILVKGYGVKDLDTNETVTEETLFGVASLSKAFASTLLVKLIEEKTKYSLNTKVSTIFNNEGIFIDLLRSKYATVRDLLSHRLGIPGNNRIRLDNNLTRANVIHRLKYLQPKGLFRDSFLYNNLIYGALTHLAELIGGDSWENLVKTHLFDPIGMNSSSFLTTADFEKIDLAKGYIEYYGDLKPVPFEFSRRWADLCGSGCVLSSARDMAKWMKFYLDEGKLANGTILISKDAFKDLTRPENIIATTYTSSYFTKPKVPVTTSNTGYALGWRTGHYRGYKMLEHSGTTFGYRALLSVFPTADHLAIYTAMTGNDPSYLYRQTLHNVIFDIVMGYKPWLNSSTICSYPRPWLNAKVKSLKPRYSKQRKPSRQITDFYGIYKNHAYGNLEVKKHKDRNKLTVVYGFSNFVLYPKNKTDEFYGESIGTTAHIFNFYSFKFSFENKTVKLEIPNFEWKDPPEFIRADETSLTNKSCFLNASNNICLVLLYLAFSVLIL